MPTYKNIGTGDFIYTQLGLVYTFPAGGVPVATNEILNPLPSNLLQISQSPTYQPIIASWSTTGTLSTIYNYFVPQNINSRYQINLWWVTGSWSVTFNGNGGQPILLGSETQAWGRTFQTRTVDNIQALCTTASSKIIVMIEQL